MTPQENIAATSQLIARDFELDFVGGDQLSEEQLFALLADHITHLIDSRLEFLLSLMYRMDIDESKVSAALAPQAPEPANIGLARLVLDRQKQRVFTKRHYRQPDLKDLDGLEY